MRHIVITSNKLMKHLKNFEAYQSNSLTQRLARQAFDSTTMERPEKSKMVAKIYTGVLYHNPKTNQYYIHTPNTEKKPYGVRGIPPAPDLFVGIVPTEEFTEEDLNRYNALSTIMTYGWEDGSGKWKDYTYKFFGYGFDSDWKTGGIHDILHLTHIERI